MTEVILTHFWVRPFVQWYHLCFRNQRFPGSNLDLGTKSVLGTSLCQANRTLLESNRCMFNLRYMTLASLLESTTHFLKFSANCAIHNACDTSQQHCWYHLCSGKTAAKLPCEKERNSSRKEPSHLTHQGFPLGQYKRIAEEEVLAK